MKTKRMVSLLLVFAMSLGLLTGCGGKKTNVEELPEGTVTLTVGIPQKATVPMNVGLEQNILTMRELVLKTVQ